MDTVLIVGGTCVLPSPENSSLTEVERSQDDGNVTARYTCKLHHLSSIGSSYTRYQCSKFYANPMNYLFDDCECKIHVVHVVCSVNVLMHLAPFSVLDRFNGTGLYFFANVDTRIHFDGVRVFTKPYIDETSFNETNVVNIEAHRDVRVVTLGRGHNVWH